MKFYRFKMTEMGFGRIPDPGITLVVFNFIRETPKGYWIARENCLFGKERWIPKKSKKRYAYPTEKEAMTNFVKRKQKRIEYLKWQLLQTELVLVDALKNQKEYEKSNT